MSTTGDVDPASSTAAEMVFLWTSIARTGESWGTWITAGSFRMWLGPPHGGQPTQDAERAGRSILTDHTAAAPRGRKKVSFDEVPLDVVSPAWRRLVVEPGGPLDRRAYTFAVLERLRAALRARDVFVPRSKRWSDPRAKLLAGAAWDTARPGVCRMLGLPMEPADALP